MVWTKWYGQNGTNKTVPIKSSINRKFQTHWQYDSFINPASTLIPLHFLCVLSTICDFWLLNKLINFTLIVIYSKTCYHFVHTTLFKDILSVYMYHIFHTILSVPFCLLPFCPSPV